LESIAVPGVVKNHSRRPPNMYKCSRRTWPDSWRWNQYRLSEHDVPWPMYDRKMAPEVSVCHGGQRSPSYIDGTSANTILSKNRNFVVWMRKRLQSFMQAAAIQDFVDDICSVAPNNL
jgi:hypothetical protein